MSSNDHYRMKLKPAAESFGIGYQKLWTAVREGELPAVQLGTQWLVRPEDIEAWVLEQGTPNAAEKARQAS